MTVGAFCASHGGLQRPTSVPGGLAVVLWENRALAVISGEATTGVISVVACGDGVLQLPVLLLRPASGG